MPATCAFCGITGKLTGEHILGDWLTKIGLDLGPVPHGTGPLNRIGRELGVRSPFRQTVRDVCGACNHGWMSRLEVVARRVLTPFILGEHGAIHTADPGAVAAWTQKTALTAMLVSSEEERTGGYGLPVSEYRELYQLRDEIRPLPNSQFWIGQYTGVRGWSVRVTPLAVRIEGLPEPDQPQGYAMTIMLGKLVLHGVRFTTPSRSVAMATAQELPQIWPERGIVRWPGGSVVDDVVFLDFVGGKALRSVEPPIQVRPWTPATELVAGRAFGSVVELPTICGKHVVHYPAVLVSDAMRGRFFWFATAFECPMAYLIQTVPDGAHCKAAATATIISAQYEDLPGEEYEIQNDKDTFWCKRLEEPNAHGNTGCRQHGRAHNDPT